MDIVYIVYGVVIAAIIVAVIIDHKSQKKWVQTLKDAEETQKRIRTMLKDIEEKQ